MSPSLMLGVGLNGLVNVFRVRGNTVPVGVVDLADRWCNHDGERRASIHGNLLRRAHG